MNTKENQSSLSIDDLNKADFIYLYYDNTIYVEMPGEYPYYRISRGNLIWDRSDKLDEYLDSELMMTFLTPISAARVMEILSEWSQQQKTK